MYDYTYTKYNTKYKSMINLVLYFALKIFKSIA